MITKNHVTKYARYTTLKNISYGLHWLIVMSIYKISIFTIETLQKCLTTKRK